MSELYNSNGKAVSTPVQTCLLAIRDKGKLRHDQFIEACITDSHKLECKSNKRHPDKKVAALVVTVT